MCGVTAKLAHFQPQLPEGGPAGCRAQCPPNGHRRPPPRCRHPARFHRGRPKIPGEAPSATPEAIIPEQRRGAGPQGKARPQGKRRPSTKRSGSYLRALLRSALQPPGCPRQGRRANGRAGGSHPHRGVGRSRVAGGSGDRHFSIGGNHSRSHCCSRAESGGCARKA